MNNQQYFQTTSLSYQLKAAQRELDSFRSGEAYVKLRKDYENIIRSLNAEIKKLQQERDGFSFSRKKITQQWMDVLGDIQKEHEKEVKKLKKTITELLDMVVSLKNRNAELDGKRKKALHDYYETAAKLEDAQGGIVKLTAQVNHNYENSSMPSSKCIGHKKITNNREKTGKKPGAQKGRNVHSAFPGGVKDDVNYDESMKAMLFLLNSRCNVSLEKTAQFVKDITDGALSPSVGMINGLCREFSLKSKSEQDSLFRSLLDAPVMHVDGTVARVNGSNNHVIVCSNGAATMYFARESKGHAAVKGTPVETFGGILIHDHESCFYSYGSDHQECMVHIERYLKDSIENEKNLTWNRQMLELIREPFRKYCCVPPKKMSDSF